MNILYILNIFTTIICFVQIQLSLDFLYRQKLLEMSSILSWLFLLSSYVVWHNCGKILVWCPGGSQSVRITYMPLVEQLAKNGHEVTIVTPFASKEKMEGITEIPVVTRFQEILDSFSR